MMMSVNKIKVNIKDLNGLDPNSYIKIPLNLEFAHFDQYEVVSRDFISKEVDKLINPIIDYEKLRFIPINNSGDDLENIKYELNFLNDTNTYNPNSYYSDLGFINSDLKFRKNNFTKSFLKLSFYDNDVATNQRLISFLSIFSRVSKRDIVNSGFGINLPLPANAFKVNFILNNPVKYPDGFSEGYYIYHYKDEVNFGLPKVLYMKAEFNNAKNGETIPFMTGNVAQDISNLNSMLYTKYVLVRNNDGYYYNVDSTYSNNITYSSFTNNGVINDDCVIKLYEMNVI